MPHYTKNAAMGVIRFGGGPIPNPAGRHVMGVFVNPTSEEKDMSKKVRLRNPKRGMRKAAKRNTRAKNPRTENQSIANREDFINYQLKLAKREIGRRKKAGERVSPNNSVHVTGAASKRIGQLLEGAAYRNKGWEKPSMAELRAQYYALSGKTPPSLRGSKKKSSKKKSSKKVMEEIVEISAPKSSKRSTRGRGKSGRILKKDLEDAISKGRLSPQTLRAVCGLPRDYPLPDIYFTARGQEPPSRGSARKSSAKKSSRKKSSRKKSSRKMSARRSMRKPRGAGAAKVYKKYMALSESYLDGSLDIADLRDLAMGADGEDRGSQATRTARVAARQVLRDHAGWSSTQMRTLDRIKNPTTHRRRRKARRKNPPSSLGQLTTALKTRNWMEILKHTAAGSLGFLTPGIVVATLEVTGLQAKLPKVFEKGENAALKTRALYITAASLLTSGVSWFMKGKTASKYRAAMITGSVIRVIHAWANALVGKRSPMLRSVMGLPTLGGYYQWEPALEGYYHYGAELSGDDYAAGWELGGYYNYELGGYYDYEPAMGGTHDSGQAMGGTHDSGQAMGGNYTPWRPLEGLPPAGWESSMAGYYNYAAEY